MKSILIAVGRTVFLGATLVALGVGTRVAFASSSSLAQAREGCRGCTTQAECHDCCVLNDFSTGQCTTQGFCLCIP